MGEQMKIRYLLAAAVFAMAAGCSGSHQFVAASPGPDRDNVRREVVRITAQDFQFTPDTIHVKAGSLVRLELRSIDGTHGFQLSAFDVDELLAENKTKIVEFYASKQGAYLFRCSHFCGLGHSGMTGNIIVD